MSPISSWERFKIRKQRSQEFRLDRGVVARRFKVNDRWGIGGTGGMSSEGGRGKTGVPPDEA